MLVMLYTKAQTLAYWFNFLWICCKFFCETSQQQIEPVEFEPHRARIVL